MSKGQKTNLIAPSEGGYKFTKADSSKGGKKRAKKIKAQKRFNEIMEIVLAMPMSDGKQADIEKVKSVADLQGKNITLREAIGMTMAKRALDGDIRAMELLLKLLGESPDDDKADINISPVIITGGDGIRD